MKFEVGDQVILRNPTLGGRFHGQFKDGDIVLIVSIHEYPAGSGGLQSGHEHQVVCNKLPGSTYGHYWVDEDCLEETALDDAEVNAAIASIMTSTAEVEIPEHPAVKRLETLLQTAVENDDHEGYSAGYIFALEVAVDIVKEELK